MSYTRVQAPAGGATGTGTTLQLAFGSNVTAGNLIVVTVQAAGDPTGVSDSLNGSHTSARAADSNNGNFCETFYFPNSAGGACTVTVSFGSSVLACIQIAEYSGGPTSSVIDGTPQGNTGFGTSVTTGSLTTTIPNALIITNTVCESSVGVPFAPGTNFTEVTETSTGTSVPGGGQLQERLNVAVGSYSGACTLAGTTNWAMQTIAFKGLVTATITGTATATINESDIVAGGKTVIATLDGDTFVADTNFPTVVSTAESSVNTAGTSHTITLPSSGVATDLFLITTDIGSTSATFNALTDWQEILDEAVANGLKIWQYTGSGVPSNPTFTSSANTRSASIAWRISNADKSITPEIGSTSTGSSTTPDPPASAAPGSTKNYLFITFFGRTGEEADDDTWATAAPTNYTPTTPLQKACGTAGTNLGGMIAAATRQLNTGSAENPGTFTCATGGWRAQTIMIHPKLHFTDARAAIRNGLDSAQSEAGGWDAKVKPNIPVANVVRTSDTVCTVTLQAQSDYDITAQETVTWTIPAEALVGNSAVVGTPTFTIDPVAGQDTPELYGRPFGNRGGRQLHQLLAT